ncbi:efflux RND transporter periplasmic adaptor subunit [Collimonas fungivorans]|uniref:CzcB-like barrel-sandwich hybrid domain-containing protein n=1 Tax=Collimonas fungivorans (strain Ter331) TaxID=1005048 RepID=G0AGY8_COLFT|nr:efflux RND transporter periplasmic adaptor subunit [Collimonas fungivorans]AEK61993.1 Hypothetical Protein CFU_2163 [Collimonas fungivorans Ter331]
MNASEPLAVLDKTSAKSSPRRKGLAIAIAVAFVAVAATAGVTMMVKSGKAEAKPVQTTPALTVTLARPAQASWAETLNASGAVAPWQEAIIGSQIGGYQLDQVRVNVGDRVKKGQVLARLNPDLLRAEEAQLVAAYEQAEANAKRAISLQGSGGISDQDVLQSTTLAKTARAQLAFKQLQLRYTDVLAPDDGVISSRSATPGSVVSTGQELFRMILKGRLEWRGEVTAEQLARIASSQQVALALPGGGTASAVVPQTAPSLDSGSRLGLVYADIADGQPVRAGMYANGSIALSPTHALTVPAQTSSFATAILMCSSSRMTAAIRWNGWRWSQDAARAPTSRSSKALRHRTRWWCSAPASLTKAIPCGLPVRMQVPAPRRQPRGANEFRHLVHPQPDPGDPAVRFADYRRHHGFP